MVILILFLGLWGTVFLAYLFYPFTNYELIKGGLGAWTLYVGFHPVVLGLGFATGYHWSGFRLREHCQSMQQAPVLVDVLRLKRYALRLLGVGSAFTIVKVAIVLRDFGVPTSLVSLAAIRAAYLFGDFQVPPLVDLLSRYPLLALSVVAGVIYWAERKARYIFGTLLVLTFNSLAIGGRGDIGFALVLYLATVLVLADISGRRISRELLDPRILLLVIGAIGLALGVFVYRDAAEQIKYAIDYFVLYFSGNIPTTAFIAEQAYLGEPLYSFASNVPISGFVAEEVRREAGFYGIPVMTFHGLLRFFQLSAHSLGVRIDLPLPDFGVLPVFADSRQAPIDVVPLYGMNSYAYAAYLVADWGLGGAMLVSFILGMAAGYAIQRVRLRATPFWLVAAILMVNLMFTSPLYMASKLISWWLAGAVSLHAFSTCMKWRQTPAPTAPLRSAGPDG